MTRAAPPGRQRRARAVPCMALEEPLDRIVATGRRATRGIGTHRINPE